MRDTIHFSIFRSANSVLELRCVQTGANCFATSVSMLMYITGLHMFAVQDEVEVGEDIRKRRSEMAMFFISNLFYSRKSDTFTDDALSRDYNLVIKNWYTDLDHEMRKVFQTFSKWTNHEYNAFKDVLYEKIMDPKHRKNIPNTEFNTDGGVPSYFAAAMLLAMDVKVLFVWGGTLQLNEDRKLEFTRRLVRPIIINESEVHTSSQAVEKASVTKPGNFVYKDNQIIEQIDRVKLLLDHVSGSASGSASGQDLRNVAIVEHFLKIGDFTMFEDFEILFSTLKVEYQKRGMQTIGFELTLYDPRKVGLKWKKTKEKPAECNELVIPPLLEDLKKGKLTFSEEELLYLKLKSELEGDAIMLENLAEHIANPSTVKLYENLKRRLPLANWPVEMDHMNCLHDKENEVYYQPIESDSGHSYCVVYLPHEIENDENKRIISFEPFVTGDRVRITCDGGRKDQIGIITNVEAEAKKVTVKFEDDQQETYSFQEFDLIAPSGWYMYNPHGAFFPLHEMKERLQTNMTSVGYNMTIIVASEETATKYSFLNTPPIIIEEAIQKLRDMQESLQSMADLTPKVLRKRPRADGTYSTEFDEVMTPGMQDEILNALAERDSGAGLGLN